MSTRPPGDDPSVALVAAVLGAIWWGLVARRLLRRSRPEPTFARDCVIGWGATAVGFGLCAYTMATQQGDIVRVALVFVAFLVVSYVWLSRQRKDLAFWFPQERDRARETGAEPCARPELAHAGHVHRLPLRLVPRAGWRRPSGL